MEYFKRMLADSGLSDQATAQLEKQLQSAGYDTLDERDALWGTTAFVSMMRLLQGPEGVRDPADLSGKKVGRNDSCPCGSGKKYKKCCMKDKKAAPGISLFRVEDIMGRSELIPGQPFSDKGKGDFDRLSHFLLEDPKLSKIRFSGHKITAFIAQTASKEGRDELALIADETFKSSLAERYFSEVESPKEIGDLEAALLDALSRCGTAADLRALGAGLTYISVAGRNDSNPLTKLIFALSLQEFLTARSKLHTVIEEYGGMEAFQAQVRQGKPFPTVEIAATASKMGLDYKTFAREAEDLFIAVNTRILQGQFPVTLPFVSVLPALVELTFLENEAKLDTDSTRKLFKETAHALTDEDLLLMKRDLMAWLDHNEKDLASEMKRDVMTVLDCLNDGELAPFDTTFIAAAIRHERYSFEEDADILNGKKLMELFSATNLEALGDYLKAKNLPQIARRTWHLCARSGPLSDSVRKKLGDDNGAAACRVTDHA